MLNITPDRNLWMTMLLFCILHFPQLTSTLKFLWQTDGRMSFYIPLTLTKARGSQQFDLRLFLVIVISDKAWYPVRFAADSVHHGTLLFMPKWQVYFVRILWQLAQAPVNAIFCVYRWFHLNFLEQLPSVEQYHAVNYSSTWLDLERVIGQQFVSHDLFLILWSLLRYGKSLSNNELNSPNNSILFSMVFELFLCGLDGYIFI